MKADYSRMDWDIATMVMMMEQSLQAADKAVMSGDVAEMIRCYNDLKEYHE